MMKDLQMLQTFSAMARHASISHSVTAENIANADTPGFQAQKVEDFRGYLGKLQSQPAGTTPEISLETILTGASPNGNTVSLEEQTLLSAQSKGQHDTAVAIYKKTLDLMRMTLGRNS